MQGPLCFQVTARLRQRIQLQLAAPGRGRRHLRAVRLETRVRVIAFLFALVTTLLYCARQASDSPQVAEQPVSTGACRDADAIESRLLLQNRTCGNSNDAM